MKAWKMVVKTEEEKDLLMALKIWPLCGDRFVHSFRLFLLRLFKSTTTPLQVHYRDDEVTVVERPTPSWNETLLGLKLTGVSSLRG